MKRLLSMLLMSAVFTVPNTALSIPLSPSLLLSQQNKQEQITQKIQVAFPDFVVVLLKSGNRVTGNFLDLNNLSLIISFKDYVAGIPLNEIQSIEFKDQVLIPANESIMCQQSNNQCRRVPLSQNQEQEATIMENIPFASLSLFQGSKTALLTIPEQSEEEESENINYLSNENIHIINSLEIDESGELITISLIPSKR
ncbi:MAG: hypothetical protein AB4057_19175 [Crocosphaera sp.]